jgi:hypothetical protein
MTMQRVRRHSSVLQGVAVAISLVVVMALIALAALWAAAPGS